LRATFSLYLPHLEADSVRAQRPVILSYSTIQRFYDQGPEAILRLVTRLEHQIRELQAQLARNPQPLIAALSKELALSKQMLQRRQQELLTERQLNHELLRRLRELERELERGAQQPVRRDSHNSSLPPSLDPPWETWTEPLAHLLLKIKHNTAEAQTEAEVGLSEQSKNAFLRCYDKWVRKAARLNPPEPKRRRGSKAAKKSAVQLTPRRLVNRLPRHRDEILRFMTDLSVPFDNNGSERDLRMVKLQRNISGCFRTTDGARAFCHVRSYLSTARKQGHPLLCSLERVLKGKPLLFQ
jgi:hypothetical protein